MAEAGIGFVDIVPRASANFGSQVSQQITPQLEQVGTTASSAIAGKASAAFAAMGVVAIGAIKGGISATQDWAGEVRQLQRVTGQSAEDASRLATAGNELGLSTSQLAQGFGILAKNIVNGSANLEKYGIATRDASGNTLPFNEVLGNISDKFNTLPPGIEQAAFAQNVFGKSGKDLIPILQQGSASLAELEGHADEYGTTLTAKDLAAVKALNLAQRQLGEAFKGAAISIGRDFIPILTDVTQGVTGIVEVFHLIPAPIRTAVLGFTALAGGAAALGKVVGFVTGGWGELGGVFQKVASFTDVASNSLDENTVSTIANADAQTSLETAAGNIGSTVQAAADVVQIDTEALDANTTATVANTGASVANAAAAEGAAAAQVAAAAASAKWLTQLQALNGIANQTGFFGNLIASATQLLNVLGTRAGQGALVFGAIQGFRELSAVLRGDLAGGFNIAASTANRFFSEGLGQGTEILGAFADGLDSGQADVDAFQIGLRDLGQEFSANNISSLQLQEGIKELADKYHIGIPDIEAFTQAIEDQNPAANDAGHAFSDLGNVVGGFAHDIHHSGREVLQSARDIYRGLRQTRNGLEDVFQTGSDVFGKLAQRAKVSAGEIVRALTRQANAQDRYQQNLEKAQKRDTPKALLDQISALGLEGGNVLNVLANTNDEKFNRIVHKWRETQRGGTDIANTFTGLGNSLKSIPHEVPINFKVTVNGQPVAVGAGQSVTSAIVPNLRGIGGGPLPQAAGGIIAGQTGFVTRGPTVLVGEGSSQTFAGKGAEGVIPFNDHGIGILAEALHRAMGRSGALAVHVTVGFDESGNLHVRKIAQDEIEREHAFRQRVG